MPCALWNGQGDGVPRVEIRANWRTLPFGGRRRLDDVAEVVGLIPEAGPIVRACGTVAPALLPAYREERGGIVGLRGLHGLPSGMGAPDRPALISLRRTLSAGVERLRRFTFLIVLRSEHGERREAESKVVLATGDPSDCVGVDIFGGRCELIGACEVYSPRHT